jgi:hypothetical protein
VQQSLRLTTEGWYKSAGTACGRVGWSASEQEGDHVRSLLPAAEDHGAFTALRVTAAVVGLVLTLATSKPLLADEGGNSLYLPGLFGSLAAVPGEPGWALAFVYYSYGGHLSAGIIGNIAERQDVVYPALTYTFAQPVLGGQLALGVATAAGRAWAQIAGGFEDSRWGFNDVVPSAVLRWNAGVHNYMVYAQTEMAARAIHISIRRPATNSQRSPA